MAVTTLILQLLTLAAAGVAIWYARKTVAASQAALTRATEMHSELMTTHRAQLAAHARELRAGAVRETLRQFQQVATDAGAVLDVITKDPPLEGGVIQIPRRFPAAARQLAISARILERSAAVQLPVYVGLVDHTHPAHAQPKAIEALMEIYRAFEGWEARLDPATVESVDSPADPMG